MRQLVEMVEDGDDAALLGKGRDGDWRSANVVIIQSCNRPTLSDMPRFRLIKVKQIPIQNHGFVIVYPHNIGILIIGGATIIFDGSSYCPRRR